MFSTYLSRGLFNPRLIFARINGPNVSVYDVIVCDVIACDVIACDVIARDVTLEHFISRFVL